MKVMREILKELILIREELQAIHRDMESSKRMNAKEMDCQLGERYKQSSAHPYRMAVRHNSGKIAANNIAKSAVLSELFPVPSHIPKRSEYIAKSQTD